ncbi:MAG TPA: hypothetical protein VF812_15115 [Ktedonobacterales bacterium]
MDQQLSEHLGAPDAIMMAQAPTRCSICRRRLGRSIHFLDETGAVPEPRQSWALCDECNSAVREQVRLSPVRSDLRLRVAVGLVATERTPSARRARFGELGDRRWEALLFWAFLLFMLAHLALIVFVAYIAK